MEGKGETAQFPSLGNTRVVFGPCANGLIDVGFVSGQLTAQTEQYPVGGSSVMAGIGC
jgi:hypothetical protein